MFTLQVLLLEVKEMGTYIYAIPKLEGTDKMGVDSVCVCVSVWEIVYACTRVC